MNAINIITTFKQIVIISFEALVQTCKILCFMTGPSAACSGTMTHHFFSVFSYLK